MVGERVSSPRSLQVLALAVGGASIVTYNFGLLITVRGLSQAHLQTNALTAGSHAGPVLLWPLPGHAVQRAAVSPEGQHLSARAGAPAARADQPAIAALPSACLHDHRHRAWLLAQLRRVSCDALGAAASVRGASARASRACTVPERILQWSPAITFITCFVTMFATVIAITKVRRRGVCVRCCDCRADVRSAGPAGRGG